MNAFFRDLTEDDINFILSSWSKSYRFSDECKRMNNDVYYKRFRKVIEKILTDSQVVIACNPDDVEQVYGWICFKRIEDIPVVHYTYIKSPFRHLGLFQKMILNIADTSKPIVCTFANKFNDHLRDKLILSFDPTLR